MAEGWARALLPTRLVAFSAGTRPHGLNPVAVQVMREAGVDISSQTSDHVDDILARHPVDAVITVCDSAAESCPAVPGVRTIRRTFDDPPALAKSAASEEEALAHYRRVRDEIRDFVGTLPSLLQAQPAGAP
jgi:arsenate reductase (thioredoxin)